MQRIIQFLFQQLLVEKQSIHKVDPTEQELQEDPSCLPENLIKKYLLEVRCLCAITAWCEPCLFSSLFYHCKLWTRSLSDLIFLTHIQGLCDSSLVAFVATENQICPSQYFSNFIHLCGKALKLQNIHWDLVKFSGKTVLANHDVYFLNILQ